MIDEVARARAERRRVSLLEKACMTVSAQVHDGRTVRDAVRRVSKRFNGKPLGDGRPLACSPDNLCRIWYSWRKSGRARASLLNGSTMPKPMKIQGETLSMIVNAALSVGARIGTAYVKLGGKKKIGCSLSTIYARVGNEIITLARKNQQLSRMKSAVYSEFLKRCSTPHNKETVT